MGTAPAPSLVPPTPLCDIELRAGIELHVDEPLFVQATSICCAESACFKRMFQVFQMFQWYMLLVFHMDVAKVDMGVAYVEIVIHICSKSLFQIFYLF